MTPRQATIAEIRRIARAHDTSLKELLDTTVRFRHVTRARWAAVAYLKFERGWHNARIGRALRMDHSSVWYALTCIERGRMPWQVHPSWRVFRGNGTKGPAAVEAHA